MKVLISTGHGRLHLVESAKAIAKTGVDTSLVCGWVPKDADGWFVQGCSRLIGHNLSSGLKKRLVPQGEIRVFPMPLVEFADQFVRLVDRIVARGKFNNLITAYSWRNCGFWTRRYLKGVDVFHVRSGAGQGGAIRSAKKCGIKVLADHSALHPAKCEENLKEDYARWGQRIPIAPKVGVWPNVIQDCKDADVVMVNADHIRDSFIEQGFSPEKVRVVRLGVRTDFFGLKKNYQIGETVKLLYTGNVSILKGVEYMLEAIRILCESKIDVHLDVVGLVSIPSALKDKYANLPITYHGPIPQDDLKSFLANSDIYLFPSLADGCAQSGMEAMSAGLPVVVTYQSGLPVSDGVNGCLVPMKDAVAIADKIRWLVKHGDDRKRIGRAAEELIRENYTWEKYGKNVKSLYQEMLGETRK